MVPILVILVFDFVVFFRIDTYLHKILRISDPFDQYDGLYMAQLLQIDVKSPPDWAVRSREYIKDFFDLKIAIFRPRSYAETGRCGCPYL